MNRARWLLALSSVLLLNLSVAFSFNLADYFPNLVLGPDPGQPDTVYVVCSHQTANQQIIQVRLKTDNVNSGDSVEGAFIPLVITTNQMGVALDTTVSTTYAGTALASWDILVVSVNSSGGDPSSFPMQLNIGGISFGGNFLGAGNHLLANLTFSVTQPTEICLDTTRYQGNGILLAASGLPISLDYTPQWRSACCAPIVPTLSEWGLIIFSILLLAGLIYYLRYPRLKLQA